jgi:hypothetical protein
MKAGRFAASRTLRLLVPLVFCMLVIVPPQTCFEIVEKLGYSGSVGEFYAKYITASGGWGMVTPTWNHLWFVAYLFVYTLLILAFGPLLKRLPAGLFRTLASGAPLIVIPFLFLLLIRATLEPMFEETHALFDDWYAHALYFPAFLFGYAIAKHEPFFDSCQRMRWPMLALGLSCWAVLMTARLSQSTLGLPPGPATEQLGVALRELQAWTLILALFGLARKHLRHDNTARRYLTDAIFPFYIIHQTTIVVAGHYLNQAQLPVGIEAPLLIAITVASCWIGYEIVRRIGILRPLFGLKLQRGRADPGLAAQPSTS